MMEFDCIIDSHLTAIYESQCYISHFELSYLRPLFHLILLTSSHYRPIHTFQEFIDTSDMPFLAFHRLTPNYGRY